MDDTVLDDSKILHVLPRIEDRIINQYYCRTYIDKPTKLQEAWVSHIKSCENPDLYYIGDISETTVFTEADLTEEQINNILNDECCITVIFNKYCQLLHKNTVAVYKDLSNGGLLSHKDIVKSLIQKSDNNMLAIIKDLSITLNY